MSRVDPLPFKEWSPEMRDALSAMTPPSPHYELISKGRPRATNILGAIAHHPSLARAFFTVQGHLLLATTLTERHREMIVMRVAALRHSTYEWVQHIFPAHDAGISDREIGWIAWGPDAPVWTEVDAAVLRAVDDIERDGSIGEEAWAGLSIHLDIKQILDLIFTVGSYGTLATMVETFGIELDSDLHEALNPPDTQIS